MDELIFACHRLATRYLLLKQNFDALGQWCRFAHRELRRGANGQNPGLFPPAWPGAAALPVRDAETGAPEDISQDHLSWKRPHDVAQLQFLGETVRHLRQKAQEMQTLVLDSPRGIAYPGNRATFVPELRFADIFRAGALESAARRKPSAFSQIFLTPFTKKALVGLVVGAAFHPQLRLKTWHIKNSWSWIACCGLRSQISCRPGWRKPPFGTHQRMATRTATSLVAVRLRLTQELWSRL